MKSNGKRLRLRGEPRRDRRVTVNRAHWANAVDNAPDVTRLATIDELVERFIYHRRLSSRTVETYESQWKTWVAPAFAGRKLHTIEPRHIREWLRLLNEADRADRTKLHVYRFVQALFRYGVNEGMLDSSPVSVPKSWVPKDRDADPRWRGEFFFSLAEVETILLFPKLRLYDQAQIALSIATGIRQGELFSLTWCDYQPAAPIMPRLRVATTYDRDVDDKGTKTEVVREIPIIPYVSELMVRWRIQWRVLFGWDPEPYDLVFPSYASGISHQRRETLRDRWAYLLNRKLNIRYRSWLSLRHTFVTLAEDHFGLEPDTVAAMTHPGPVKAGRTAKGGYARRTWPRKCQEMEKFLLWPEADQLDMFSR